MSDRDEMTRMTIFTLGMALVIFAIGYSIGHIRGYQSGKRDADRWYAAHQPHYTATDTAADQFTISSGALTYEILNPPFPMKLEEDRYSCAGNYHLEVERLYDGIRDLHCVAGAPDAKR